MQQTISAELSAAAPRVYEVVSDLTTYPAWLALVGKVEREGGDAWWVTLRAKLGPLTRSKRLRMECTEAAPPGQIRFERREVDGRDHSAWVLEIAIRQVNDHHSELTMDLHYDGGLWTRPLESVLQRQVDSPG